MKKELRIKNKEARSWIKNITRLLKKTVQALCVQMKRKAALRSGARCMWQYIERASEAITQRFAGSRAGASGSARRQGTTAQMPGGFTVVELTIATAVFATVLLVGLVSFLGIGKVYYKGVSLTQTQAVAQQILTQLSGDIQFAPTVKTATSTGDGTSQFICLGNVRYTFNLYRKVDLADHDNQSKFGLLRDTLPGSTGCSSPFGDGAIALNNPTELLGNKMRLAKLGLNPAKNAGGGDVTDLWDLDIKVAYGDDEVLTNPGAENVTCDANLSSTQFCSVSSQNTTVSRGL